MSIAGKTYQTEIAFYVVNYGESEAILVNVQYSVFVNVPLGMEPSYQSEFRSNFNRKVLASGEGVRNRSYWPAIFFGIGPSEQPSRVRHRIS
jgi:hypothetical protein